MSSNSKETGNIPKSTPRSDITKSAVLKALSQVHHPEVKKHNLVELGMISNVSVDDRRISLTLALPFQKAPTRDDLLQSVRVVLNELAPGTEVEIDVTEMTPEKRAAFFALAQGRDPSTEAKRSVRNILAVMSGKGGVGKSSMAGLLACTLRQRDFQVGILDADITGPSIPRLFGVHKVPVGGSEGIIPPETETGIKLISINLMLSNEDQPVVWRGPLIGRAIQQFWSDIAWGDLDFLVVDLPPGTSDAALTVMQSLPVHGIVLVTTPQDLAGMIVRKAANMANQLGIHIIGLVENMSYAICPKCGNQIEIFGPSRAEETAQKAGIPLLGSLPLDPQFSVMCDHGRIEAYDGKAFDPITDQVLKQSTDRGKHDAGAQA